MATAASAVPAITQAIAATAPPKQDFLQKLGSWFKNKFEPAAKVVEKDVTIAAEVAEPVIDIAFPAVAGVYNTTVQMVVAAEAAAGGATGVGAQKMASVVNALTPIALPYLKSIGVSNPSITQIEGYVQSVVDGLKIFTSLTTPPVAPVSTPVAAATGNPT